MALKNIDQMLMEQHLSKKARRSKSKHHLKGPAKRTAKDDKAAGTFDQERKK